MKHRTTAPSLGIAFRSAPGRLVDRHVSVLKALMAYGLAEEEARALIAATRAAGGNDYRVERNGLRYVIRQMKGNHADVFELAPP